MSSIAERSSATRSALAEVVDAIRKTSLEAEDATRCIVSRAVASLARLVGSSNARRKKGRNIIFIYKYAKYNASRLDDLMLFHLEFVVSFHELSVWKTLEMSWNFGGREI